MDQMPSACGNSPVVIRAMTRPEVDFAVAWAAAEGWNPGRHDAACFYETDPEAFWVAEENGRPVGCVSNVVYDETFCFMGFFIVLAECRKKGYGAALGQAALERAGARIVGIDGVVAQQENYRKAGFSIAYNNIRFEAVGHEADRAGVVPLAPIPLGELAAYDARFFPVPRRRFLEHWTTMPESFGYAVLAHGRLAGYGVIRACTTGFKIGPLFADDPDHAETLYRALASHAPGAPVYLDIPEVNAQAVALARRHGMTEVFRTARMYLNGTPRVELDGVYGVTSFELG